jgi:DNA-binding response OmpR family regulator
MEGPVSSGSPLVLIVDDDEDSCEMYVNALGLMGFQAITEQTGERGFERACDLQPDAVVADVTLPGISGLELISRLRKNDRTREAAIIVLTGRAFDVDEHQAATAGCDRFLVKLCLPDELAFEIRSALARPRPTTLIKDFDMAGNES